MREKATVLSLSTCAWEREASGALIVELVEDAPDVLRVELPSAVRITTLPLRRTARVQRLFDGVDLLAHGRGRQVQLLGGRSKSCRVARRLECVEKMQRWQERDGIVDS